MVIRTPSRLQSISWEELTEVRWRREAQHDLLLFCTNDGREIKASGVHVTDTGFGKKYAVQVLTHVPPVRQR